MKYLSLVWAGLWRKPARTLFTMICIAVAFILFGLLQGVNSAFSEVIARQRLDRLFVDSRFGRPLPISYLDRIKKIPDVAQITEAMFIPGYYQDPKNQVLVVGSDPDIWLQIRSEFHLPDQQREAMGRVRTGVVISDWLAVKNGWKIGDNITLHTSTATVAGDSNWTFEVVGIMTSSFRNGSVTLMLANYSYCDEARAQGKGLVARFLLRIKDARRIARVSRQIDEQFASSNIQTLTQSDHEMAQSYLAGLGDLGFFTRAIMGAVFFTLLALTSNTMMESVRERTAEFAVLKTLGYSDSGVLALVLSESLLLCVTGSLLGLAIAAAAFPLAKTYALVATLPRVVVILGEWFAIAVALVSAIIPARRAARLNVVNALAVR